MPPPGKWDKGKGKVAKSKGKGCTDGSTAATHHTETGSRLPRLNLPANSSGAPKVATKMPVRSRTAIRMVYHSVLSSSEGYARRELPALSGMSSGQAQTKPKDSMPIEMAVWWRQALPGTSKCDAEATKTSQLDCESVLRHVELEGEIERDFQEETYGSNAMRMMEKMGYKAGSGLGKENQGRTSLLGSLRSLGAFLWHICFGIFALRRCHSSDSC